jgi:hypothetical protein
MAARLNRSAFALSLSKGGTGYSTPRFHMRFDRLNANGFGWFAQKSKLDHAISMRLSKQKCLKTRMDIE